MFLSFVFDKLNRLNFVGRNIHASGILYKFFLAVRAFYEDVRHKKIALTLFRR